MITRTSATLTLSGFGSESDSETGVEFGTVLGAALGIQQLFLTAGFWVDTFDDSDTVFMVGFGLTF